ncbi:MAG TPA: PAS domain S-box protein, partial [Humisphaera sp.]
MRARVRGFDWARTPLGPRGDWPQALRVAVDICLNSRFPMFVWWGPDHVNIYNDAYVPILGKRHPAALGRAARETWGEIWDVVGPQAERVMTRGESTWNERVLLVMERHGFPEATYFTWSYSPIHEDGGDGAGDGGGGRRVAGLFCACTEETERVTAERERDRLAAQRQLALDAAAMGWLHYDPRTGEAAYDARAAEVLGVTGTRGPMADVLARVHPDDLPGVRARLEAAARLAGPNPFAGECRVVRDGGEVRWVEARMLATAEPAGPDRRAAALVGTVADVTDRRVTEEARGQLVAVVESSDDAIVTKTLDGVIRSWNAGAERVFGYAADEIVGRPVLTLIPPDRHAEEADILRRLARGDRIDHFESQRVTKDGRLIDVSLSISPIKDAAGRIVGASKVARDVTRQKAAARELDAAQAAVRASEARLRSLVEQSAAGIVHAGLGGRILFANRRFGEIVGRPPAALAGTLLNDLTHPDDVAATAAAIAGGATTGREYALEKRYVRPDGSAVWVSVAAGVLKDDRGAPESIMGVVVDVTDRKLAEARLREETNVVETVNRVGRTIAAELDLGRLVQSVTDATTGLTGAEFGAFFYNVTNERGESYALYTLSGVPRERFERFPMPRNTDIFAPTFRGDGVVRLDDVTADPRFGRSAPYHGMPAGHLPVRSYLAVPVVSRSGEVLGGLFLGHATPGVFTDRHERLAVGIAAQTAVAIDNAHLFEAARRANAEKDRLLESERAARGEAERQGRLKDEFVSTLSHELRTPLNAILGYAQLLRRDPAIGVDTAEGLAVIERNARVQAQIVEDILDVSRIVSGKMRLDVQRVDLPAVIDAALDTCRPAADARGVRVVRLVDPDAGPVNGDPARLQQCVWNLVANSIKFSPKGARVQVVLRRVESHVEVAVGDTGQGIRPDFLPHVFDRFRQADASTTRRTGGLGLGLSIVKSLVELHGGTVRAHSDGEGRGATFTISLPLAPLDPPGGGPDRRHPRAPREAAPYEGPSLAGIRVLAVDDEPDARDLVRRLLEDCGASVVTAGSAAEGLAALDAGAVDLIVSDVGMPEVDGYEFVRRVRRRGPARGGAVPAVALTAYARSEDRTRAMLAGFTGHV